MRSIRTLLILLSFLFLAACGGGGGVAVPVNPPPLMEPGPQPPPPDPAPQPEPDPDPDPEPASPPEPEPEPMASVPDILESLIGSSNRVIDAETIDNSNFLWSAKDQTKPSSLMLSDMTSTAFNATPLEDIGSRNGVSRGLYQDAGETFGKHSFAGWMNYSFFLLDVNTIDSGGPLRPMTSTFPHAHSLGSSTGTNPVGGSATWVGIMAGAAADDNGFDGLVEGDARVTVNNFSNPAVNVAFTNIRDRRTSAAYGNISWSGVPVSGGAFSTTGLKGRFYGPGHEEVGGVFLRGRISGAFGATR